MTSAQLHRTTLTTSRLLDFASEKELVAQTGHNTRDWPLVVLKELVDNALDACEEANIAPNISVDVNDRGIAVQDNGPGIPEDTIKGVLDFAVRVSSREAYMAPDRGAQGNALKTIVAIPFVLDGEEGKVIISANGVDYVITFQVDRIRQAPCITLDTRESFVRNGTRIQVVWPESSCSILEAQAARFLQIADDYTWINPHLSLSVDFDLGETRLDATNHATNLGWKKWKPSDPTSPHWYTLEDFERLVSGYIAHDADQGRERLVREFISEFKGLSGSAKQKVVLDITGLGRMPLGALINGNGLDHGRTKGLLESLQAQSTLVKPGGLGVIGREHLEARMKTAGCDPESIEYRKTLTEGPLPEVYEFAFGYCPEGISRRLVTGVNWSPGIVNPFRQIRPWYSLDSILAEARTNHDEPVVIFLHVASPVVRYTDRGKSAVVIT